MLTYTNLQQRKKEEGGILRKERDQIKFIDFKFKRWEVVGFGKGRKRKDAP